MVFVDCCEQNPNISSITIVVNCTTFLFSFSHYRCYTARQVTFVADHEMVNKQKEN